MSKNYRLYTGIEHPATTDPAARLYHSRPGRHDEEGNIVYFTEQSHKSQCDVNSVLKKYNATGLISHIAKFEGQFGDTTALDFKNAYDLVINAQNMFDDLPSDIRNRFKNDPMELLGFMEHESNRDEAIKLGIISSSSLPSLDGLGEHVVDGAVAPPDPAPAAE